MQNNIDKRVFKVVYSKEELENRISELASWVNNVYAKTDGLIIVGLLKGCVPFLAQLIKDVTVDHKLDFMIASSYAGGSKSLGSVKIIMDMAEEIANKDVLIVEDIIDSGITLNKVKEILETRNPKSIRILTLLDKPYRRKVALNADMFGFHAPDEFLVGFGLDYQEEMRNLPYVGIFNKEYLK